MPPASDSPNPLHGARVRLRQWTDAELAPFAAMNADPEVRRHIGAHLSGDERDATGQRIRAHLDSHGFGRWALDVPGLGFDGFVGISPKVPFELSVAGIAAQPHEIGWRLAKAAWGHGDATEAATLALRDGFKTLGLPQIVSFTAVTNTASPAVMQRIGLVRRAEFDHPRLAEGQPLRRHVLYTQDAPFAGAQPS